MRILEDRYCQVGQRSGLWQGLGHEHDVQPLPKSVSFAVQWLADTLPYQRFTGGLAADRA
jgi:hypothetical protein